MLEALDQVDWDGLAQPPTNVRGAVPASLRVLAVVASQSDAEDAYHRVLFAFGNNHSGTYYPVAVSAVPFLGDVLRDGASEARETTLEILIELVGSFEPEIGYETIETAGGDRRDLRVVLEAAVRGLAPHIRACTNDESSERERALARELLRCLEK
jgi:hypothetical protein